MRYDAAAASFGTELEEAVSSGISPVRHMPTPEGGAEVGLCYPTAAGMYSEAARGRLKGRQPMYFHPLPGDDPRAKVKTRCLM